jgi:hypothetical protein
VIDCMVEFLSCMSMNETEQNRWRFKWETKTLNEI